MCVIIVAVTEGLVREEQLLHDMCLLSATTVEITQILTRAGPKGLKYIWTPLKMEPGLVTRWNSLIIIYRSIELYIHLKEQDPL
jgi:hypothetical protein